MFSCNHQHVSSLAPLRPCPSCTWWLALHTEQGCLPSDLVARGPQRWGVDELTSVQTVCLFPSLPATVLPPALLACRGQQAVPVHQAQPTSTRSHTAAAMVPAASQAAWRCACCRRRHAPLFAWRAPPTATRMLTVWLAPAQLSLHTPPKSAARSQPQYWTCQTMLRCCADLPLHKAVKAGDVQGLKWALAAGADVDAMDPHGRGSAVTYAAGLEQEECLQVLLEAGASPAVRLEAFGASMTPLFIAANGRPGCVRLLLRHGADSHARNEGGGTPLMAAAAGGHLECLDALIEGGADIREATPEYDQTALHLAALNGHPGCVQALIKVTKWHSIRQEINQPLCLCLICCPRPLPHHSPPHATVLQAGAQVEHAAVNGGNALICAAKSGSAECVDILIKAGANLEARTDNGSTPGEAVALAKFAAMQHRWKRILGIAPPTMLRHLDLWLVCSHLGMPATHPVLSPTLTALLPPGAAPLSSQSSAHPAVMVAAACGHAACVKALLHAGARVDATNDAGLTAQLFACKAHGAECLEALLDASADVNAMGGHPAVTALYMAALGPRRQPGLCEAAADMRGTRVPDYGQWSGCPHSGS